MVLATVAERRIVDVNDAAQILMGRERAELIGRTSEELGFNVWVSPEERARVHDTVNRTSRSRDVRARIRRLSGEQRDVLLSTETIECDGEDRILYVAVDVTTQAAAERSLEEAQAIGRVGSWSLDVCTQELVWSHEACRIFGLTAVTYDDFYKRIHPDDRWRVIDLAERSLANGTSWHHSYRIIRPDGTMAWIASRGAVERGEDGKPARMLGTVQDITELYEAGARLEASQQRFGRVLETATFGVLICDNNGTISFINHALAATLRMTPDELRGRVFDELVTSEDRVKIPEYRRRRMAGQSATYDLQVTRSDGELATLEITSSPLVDGTGKVEGVLGMVTDVTQRRQSDALRARLAAVVESSRDAITSCSLDGTIETWNPAAERLFGYSAREAIGVNFANLVPADRLGMYNESIAQVLRGEVVALDTVRIRKDGSPVEVTITRSPVMDAAGNVVGVSTIARDITTQRRLESSLRETEGRLQHLQRMEAIGALAGGIAHDFNNILSVILSSATLIEESLEPDDPIIEDACAIRDATERATTLTRQLLAFSRKQMLEPRVVILDTTLTGMEKLLRRLLGERISLVTHAVGAGNVLIDVSQFEQVILNLAVNARDAMPDGGELTIDCEDVRVDKALAAPGVEPGEFVRITVTDNGVGMDEATLARIFEPFFTTKPKGKGTGLGLATVFGIVRQSGGFMRVHSTVGRGSSFEIYVPRTERAPSAESTAEIPMAVSGKGETILVVEDEEPVRKLVHRILRRQGYDVVTASNAGEALLICEQRPQIDVVLTDVMMPIMNGRQLAERLLVRYPTLRIAYMSGYHDDEKLHDMVGNPNVVFLQKPLRREVLVRKIRELLDRDRARAPS